MVGVLCCLSLFGFWRLRRDKEQTERAEAQSGGSAAYERLPEVTGTTQSSPADAPAPAPGSVAALFGVSNVRPIHFTRL